MLPKAADAFFRGLLTRRPYTRRPYTRRPYTRHPYTRRPYTRHPCAWRVLGCLAT